MFTANGDNVSRVLWATFKFYEKIIFEWKFSTQTYKHTMLISKMAIKIVYSLKIFLDHTLKGTGDFSQDFFKAGLYFTPLGPPYLFFGFFSGSRITSFWPKEVLAAFGLFLVIAANSDF